ncbi:MAG: malto-oligosyltrehalose synthase [Candidatus Limnocylindria bacterium]
MTADRVPRATYRVQMHAGFTLDDALSIVPYLAELGISHLYTSPLLQAAPGSTHGYDVVDPGRVNDELGGAAAFERLTDALRAHGMGLILDIVPNHMAISSELNRWWWDVLELGPASRYASWFDVDWTPGHVLLPVLGDDGNDAIRLVRDAEGVVIQHAGRRYPLAPGTLTPAVSDEEIAAINADPDRLDALLAQQRYRLVSWRASRDRLNYRRFFDINDLIGIRVEDRDTFAETHRLILRWVSEGLVDGLRIDHPDGLRDPAGYLAELRTEAPNAWIVVEKILGAEEALRPDWQVDGTTGYRFANLATGLLVDPAGEAGMTATWASVADADPAWDAIVEEARIETLSSVLGSDVNRLTEVFAAVCAPTRDRTHDELRNVLREVAARLPVYRTYVTDSPRRVTDEDAALIEAAVAGARDARPDLDPNLFASLGRVLRLEVDGDRASDLAMRFQQLTPPAMAKGVEDTALYRHHRLVALNEVGGDPGRFGTSPAEFHRSMADAQSIWPTAMLALSTHDTKRSADLRARLALLSEDPDGWRDAVDRLASVAEAHRPDAGRPTPADAYLFFQTVVGAWPIDADRAADYLAKASREAKLHTSWTDPEPAYDRALAGFVRGCLADPAFVTAVEATVAPLVDAGRRAALAQLALQLTAPGVPDVYQGSELWDLSLVDPDNRRPVDYEARRRLLADIRQLGPADAWSQRDEGLPKMWLIRRALELRARRASAFGAASTYEPLMARGAEADAVVGFVRGSDVITVVPRLVRRIERLGWGDTVVDLPSGSWTELDGSVLRGSVPLGELFSPFPVAILEHSA